MPATTISGAPGADGTWTTPLIMMRDKSFSISVSGTFVATVYLQRCNRGDDTSVAANWKDVTSYTAPIEEVGYTGGKGFFRIGVKSGGYSSGSAVVSVDI